MIFINLNSFIYLGSSQFSDIPITHYPNLLLIQKSIIKDHQIPLWSNLIFSGYPFAENPLSGLWYFPGWIALIFPLPAGINIALLLHLFVGLLGMVLFLRSQELSEKAAIFGGIGFLFSSKIYGHVGAGHLSLLYAISWTPWLLYFTNKYSKEKKFLKVFITNSIFWGLILLADLRWSIPAFLIWVTLILINKIHTKDFFTTYVSSIFAGSLLSSASWIPLLHFLGNSTRNAMSTNEQMVYSFSLADLLNLFFPFFEGNTETKIYPGSAIFLLTILGIFLYQQNQPVRKWYLLGLFAFVLSFGGYIPGMEYLYKIPGFSFIRVPSRFLFVLVFCLVIISAFIFEQIVKNQIDYKFKRIFFLVPIISFVVLFSIGSIYFTNTISLNLVWAVLVFSISFSLIAFILSNKEGKKWAVWGLLVVLFIDLAFVNLNSLRFKSSKIILNENRSVVEHLEGLSRQTRIYTPSYSITQEQGAYWNINQINGVDPMQLANYVNYFNANVGVPNSGYSITLPPFSNGNPDVDNIGYCPDKKFLIDLNTIYIISDFDLNNCGLGIPTIIDSINIYDLNSGDNYVENGSCINETKYKLSKHSPNEILLTIDSCGGVVQVSEINYPGWKVFVDGDQVDLDNESIFRKFTITPGEHEIRMTFRPKYVYIGLFIQVISWLFILILFRKLMSK